MNTEGIVNSNVDGQILVYTGQGKGKTTAALGIAFRALGYGLPVAMIQYVKGKWVTGERLFAETLKGLDFHVMGLGFTWESDDLSQDKKAAEAAWELSRRLILAGEHQIVVLDEITYVLNYGFISLPNVLATLKDKPPHVTVVITGRNAPTEIIEIADLVTEMSLIKHPFKAGKKAVRGVDY